MSIQSYDRTKENSNSQRHELFRRRKGALHVLAQLEVSDRKVNDSAILFDEEVVFRKPLEVQDEVLRELDEAVSLLPVHHSESTI